MRRRSHKTSPEAPAPTTAPDDDVLVVDDVGAAVPGPWEDWGESESERVARWLQGKVRPDIEVVDDPEPGPPRAPATDSSSRAATDEPAPLHVDTRYEAEMWRLDQQRRRLAVELDAERAQAERARREQLDGWARLEAEMTALDEKRRRLADAVEAERSEVERVRHEQSDARARLEAAMAELDEHRRRLLDVQAEKSEAERARQEHVEARAALQADVDAIDEQRHRLMAAVEDERAEAERARQAHADARGRLEAEMVELDQQRRRLAEAVELGRAEVERARTEQLEAKERLAAEVAALDGERQALLAAMEADRAEAARVATERAEAARAAAEQAAAADAETARAELARAEAELAVAAAERATADLAAASQQAAEARRAAAERAEADRAAAEQAAAAHAASAEAAAAARALTSGPAPPVARRAWGGGERGGADAIDLTSRRATGAARPGPTPPRHMRLVPGAQPPTAPEAPAPSSEDEQAEAKARLAAAVAELARHVATTHADERIDAELLDQQMRRDEARRRADEEAAAEQRRRTAGAQQAARATVDGRSQRWVWQVLVAIAVLVPIGLDIRSPIAARSRLDGVADTVATSAAVELSGSGDPRSARQVAQGVADLEGVRLEAFSLEGPVVRVTVSDEAGSILLGKLVPTWYEVERSAEATAATGR